MQTNSESNRLEENLPKHNGRLVTHREGRMNATNHASGRRSGKGPSCRPGTAARVKMGVLLTLGLLGFAAVVIAVVSGSMPAASKNDPPASYVRSWRLTSGVRTAVEMVRYLLEPERAGVTEVNEPGPTQTNLALPTTAGFVEPKP